jgi:hypothetical protein
MNTLPELWKKSGAPALCGAVALLTLLACVPGAAAAAAAAPAAKGKGVLGAIHAEKKAGNIDEGRAALYRLWAATDHKKLPPHIRQQHQAARGAANEPSEIRCGTPIIIDVLSKLDLMDTATRKLAEEALPGFSKLTPLKRVSSSAASGAVASLAAAAKTRPAFSLPNRYETPNFVFGWFNGLTNEDGSPLLPGDYTDDVPNVVLAWAKYFERSFEVITTELGFSDAGLGGLKIPVALSSPDAPSGYVIGGTTYGLTSPFFPHEIVVNYDYSFIIDHGLLNEDPDGYLRGAMKVTAAHELLHVFHFLYAPSDWDATSGSWWMETTSTWLEDYVFSRVNDYVNYLPTWFDSPEWSLEVLFDTTEGSPWKLGRQYGGVIFAKYLSEHFTGPDAIIDSWEFIRDTQTDNGPLFALDFIADSSVTGWTAEDLYLGFSGANATLDYEDGENYRDRVADYIRSSASLAIASTIATLPEYLGATYLKDIVANGGEQAFFYTSTNDNAADWGLGLVHVPWGAGYGVVLAKRDAAVTQVILADAAAPDTLYGVPSFLNRGTDVDPDLFFYTTEHFDGETSLANNTISPNDIALAATQVTTVDPMTIKVDWDSATDPDGDDIGGYVVQYKPITEPDWTDISVVVSRTIYGDNSQAWLGGLVGEADYDVRVAAYDIFGNVGTFSNSQTQTAGVEWPYHDFDPDDPDSPWEIPTPPADPTPDPVAPSGGGGGGGGCFLGMLAPTVEIYGL